MPTACQMDWAKQKNSLPTILFAGKSTQSASIPCANPFESPSAGPKTSLRLPRTASVGRLSSLSSLNSHFFCKLPTRIPKNRRTPDETPHPDDPKPQALHANPAWAYDGRPIGKATHGSLCAQIEQKPFPRSHRHLHLARLLPEHHRGSSS
jgi:hypothetical protein